MREKVASSILEGGPVRDGEVKLAPVFAAYVVGVALFLALAGLPALGFAPNRKDANKPRTRNPAAKNDALLAPSVRA